MGNGCWNKATSFVSPVVVAEGCETLFHSPTVRFGICSILQLSLRSMNLGVVKLSDLFLLSLQRLTQGGRRASKP